LKNIQKNIHDLTKEFINNVVVSQDIEDVGGHQTIFRFGYYGVSVIEHEEPEDKSRPFTMATLLFFYRNTDIQCQFYPESTLIPKGFRKNASYQEVKDVLLKASKLNNSQLEVQLGGY